MRSLRTAAALPLVLLWQLQLLHGQTAAAEVQEVPDTVRIEAPSMLLKMGSSAPGHQNPAGTFAPVFFMVRGNPRRSSWQYPLIGAVAGGIVGAVWGTYLMRSADEWLAPPAHFITIPLGAAVGAALGLIANEMDRP
jgi:hypothetical protein